MNVKTIKKKKKKTGLALIMRTDEETGETIYTLQDNSGNEVIEGNSKRLIYQYLPLIMNRG